MQRWSVIVATSPSPSPSSAGSVVPKIQPSAITTTPSPTHSPVAEPSVKDYIPVPIVVGVIAGLLAIIGTLIWKWHEAEIKRIEAQKNGEIERIGIEKSGEIKLLDEQKRRELSEKDTKISILEAKLESLKREQEVFRELSSIAPLEYLRETKPVLENMIEELKMQISSLKKEKDDITAEKEKFRLELESKLETFESNLQKLSILEKYLVERSVNIKQAYLWLEKNRSRLAEEVCKTLLEQISNQGNSVEQEQFTSDISDYLIAIGECLDIGRANVLDKARAQIPLVVHPRFYAEAFKVIRDKKLLVEQLDESARVEIEIYLNHLIKLFQSEFT